MFVASVLPRVEWRMVGSVCDCRIGLRQMLAQTLMALLLSFSWSILLEQLTQLQLLQNSPFAKQSQYLTESDTEHRNHELWYLLGQFLVVHINKYSIINCNLEARPSGRRRW